MAPVRIVIRLVLLSLLCGVFPAAPRSTVAGATQQRYSGTLTLAWYNWSTETLSYAGPFPYGGAGLGSGGSWYGAQPLVDTPITVDDRGRYFADLATVVPTVANGGVRVVNGDEVVTVRLKPGQRWSDGSPITPADYTGSMLLSYAPVWGSAFLPYKTVTASPSTLIVTYDGIVGPALDNSIPAPIPIEYLQRKYGVRLSAKLLASFNSVDAAALYASPSYQGSALQRLVQRWSQDLYNGPGDVFNGPYMPARPFTAQLAIEVPNPYYAALAPDPRHLRPAQIRTVVLKGDYLKAVTAPGARNYDFVTFPFPELAAEPADLQFRLARAGYRVVLAHNQYLEHLELNLDSPALRDVRVRRALSYAIDREAYLLAVLPQLTPAQRDATLDAAPWPFTSPWSINGQLPRNPYDPAKARALLAAAGYATSAGGPGRHLSLDFVTNASPFRATSARTLQRLLAPFGITLRLHFISQHAPIGLFAPYDQGGVLARGHFDIVEFAYGTNVELAASATPLFDPGQVPDANHPNGENYSRVRDVPLLQLLTQATHTLDDGARYQLSAQVQRRVVDNVYWIPLFDWPYVVGLRATFGNFRAGSLNFPMTEFWNAFEWYRSGTD